jgi:RNA polymerase sigma factor (sigma-70 family)
VEHNPPPPESHPVVATVPDRSSGADANQVSANNESIPDAKIDLGADFARWIEPIFKDMLHYAIYLTADPDEGHDVAQQAGMKLFSHWTDPRFRAKIKEGGKGYAIRTVKNDALEFWRSIQRNDKRLAELSTEAVAAMRREIGGPDVETIMTVRQAVSSLESQQSALIFLVYYKGSNLSAAGRELKMNAQKAHRIHLDAMKALRSLLEPMQKS